jgi:tetratricopeptide (TPR) repeat protein
MSESTQGSAADVSGLAIRETSLAWCYAATGAFDKAEPLYKAALVAVKRAEQKAGTLTGTVEERYGIGLFLAARDDQAEPMLRAAHAHLLATIGEDGLTAEALTFLGWLELRERRLADAEKTLREAYREAVPGAGADHRITLRALACLGLAELENGAAEAGSADLRNALQQYDRVLGPQAPETQFFRYMWLAHRLATRDGASDSDAAVNGLSAQRIANAAPWEDWNANLREIKSGVSAPLRER